ncbi:hypothetical protein Tco_1267607 [Tanacetum coccineum]
MDKKIHNFMTPVGKIYMVNSIHNDEPPHLLDISSRAPSYEPPQFEKSNNLHHQNNNDNYMQERSSKKVWPTCDPTMELCNEGIEIYGIDEHGVLKYWYGHTHGNDLIWDSRYAEWCSENSIQGTPTSIFYFSPRRLQKGLFKVPLVDPTP